MSTLKGPEEAHPAFGHMGVNRVSSTPGASLFDSEVKHQHYITLRISHAKRQRDLNRDWIFPTGQIIEVALSEAQWAALVSSPNSEGTPVTLTWIRGENGDAQIPSPPFEPRLALSHAETRSAADRAFDKIKEARDAYAEHKTAANLRTLNAAIDNAGSNVEVAARSLTEHVESVTQKARADIEAMVRNAQVSLGGEDPREHEALESLMAADPADREVY